MSAPHDTDALIAALAGDVAPVRPHATARRVGKGLIAGALVTLVLVAAGLGFRPDLWLAMHGSAFWIKWIYTGSLALLALMATFRLGRPDAGTMGWLWLAGVPVAGLAVIGMVEMAQAPRGDWLAMWLGHSWRVCSMLVFLLSLPIFGGLLWSYRALAPTRLRLAGANAGLAAGAWSATLYCLHCPEVSAIFVLTWYTLGIALAAMLGAWVGPRLMRW
jgi:hypothetical protein